MINSMLLERPSQQIFFISSTGKSLITAEHRQSMNIHLYALFLAPSIKYGVTGPRVALIGLCNVNGFVKCNRCEQYAIRTTLFNISSVCNVQYGKLCAMSGSALYKVQFEQLCWKVNIALIVCSRGVVDALILSSLTFCIFEK